MEKRIIEILKDNFKGQDIDEARKELCFLFGVRRRDSPKCPKCKNDNYAELDNIGEIIDVIIMNSDELIDFESITFDLEDKTTIIKSAREIAVKNAMEKAQEIASTANIKLGNPKYINEISSPSAFESVSDMPMMAMARAESFIETPIMSGDISVSVQVQMHFDINDN